jgi:hypothetical protein
MVDSQLEYLHQIMKNHSRVSFQSHVAPPGSAMLTFASKGMEHLFWKPFQTKLGFVAHPYQVD